MALKVLLLRKQRDELNKKTKQLQEEKEALEKREAEAETAIDELTEDSTEEEKEAVNEEVEAIEAAKADLEQQEADLNEEVRKIEESIEALEKEQGDDPEEEPEEAPEEKEEKEEREDNKLIKTRNDFYGMNRAEQAEFVQREDVKALLSTVRSALTEKRAITGAGLTIPEVMLGMIRENIMEYSKLYKHATVRAIKGNGREVVMGTIPEAVWEDCCGILNELDLTFNDAEVGCWKVAGYFDICNAELSDSDVDLAGNLIEALGQAIGLALDKAILYGLGTRMPLGIVTRLAQTSQPADYPSTARTWVDLHSSNVIKINKTGVELFQAILENGGLAKGKYSRGEKVWAMNEKTYTYLQSQGLSINAAGAIVSGINGTMPVAGGVVEVLDFIPDYDVITGYFDLYLLAERQGTTIDQSEHVHFIQDRTVFRGRARYDGLPVIAEGFVLLNVKNTNPTTSVDFAPDTANAESE